MKLSFRKKKILIGITSCLLIISVLFVSIGLIKKINQNRVNKTLENKIYGTVSEIGKNYIKVDSLDDDEYLVGTSEELNLGDFIVVYYNENDEELIKNSVVEVIAEDNEVIIESSKATTTTKLTTKAVSSTVVTTKTTVINKDETVLTYIEDEYKKIDMQEIKDKAKTSFITIVDFIFYDGEINGVTWNSIKTSTKAKVIYYALLMDNKLENKWPNYKNNIENKYNDIKSKLVAKYMDITTSLCNEHPEECEVTKKDFAVLKASLNLTWDVIKTAFQYAYDKGVTYLVNWYEIYSGKK